MVTNGPQRERSLLEAEESLSEVTAPAAIMAVPQSSDSAPAASCSVNPSTDPSCDTVNLDFGTINYNPQSDPQLDQLSVPAFSQALRTDIKQEKIERGASKEFSSVRRQQAKQRLQRMKNRQRGKQPKRISTRRGDGTILDILVSALADALKSLDNAIFRRQPAAEVVNQKKKVQKTEKHHDRHHAISTGFFGDASKEQHQSADLPSATLSTARQND